MTTKNRDEDGSLILDIVIGMAIFGLIAIIAVMGFGQWRQRAYQHAVLSDAKRLGDLLNARLTDDNSADVAAFTGSPGSGGTVRFAAARGTGARLVATGDVDKGGDDFDLTTVTDPLAATEISLYPGNRLIDWATNGRDFSFCIEHGDAAKVDAWAAYRSDKGGVYAHGKTGGCAAVPSEDGGPSSPMDPSASPSPSDGPTSSPTSSPTESASPSPSASPTPTQDPVPANNQCKNATEITQPAADNGVGTSGVTTNKGAPDGTVWFHTWAPISAYMTFAVEGTDGSALGGSRTLVVYKASNSSTNNLACPDEASMTRVGAVTGSNPGLSFRSGSGNENYFVKVTSTTADAADFRVRLHFHTSTIQRDNYSGAEGISVNQNQTQDFNPFLQTTLWGTVESGEKSAGWSTVWYRLSNFYSTATPRYTLTTLAPSDPTLKPLGDHTVEIFSGGTSASSPGTLVASASGTGSVTLSWDGPANGKNFMIRISSLSGRDAGYYSLRLARGAN